MQRELTPNVYQNRPTANLELIRSPSVQLYFLQSTLKKFEDSRQCTTLRPFSATKDLNFERNGEVLSVQLYFPHTNGQIYIVEIPGGQPNNSRLLVGPHLIGPGADLAPVTLSFVGDEHSPDLVISVDGVQMRFHNTGSTYVPET